MKKVLQVLVLAATWMGWDLFAKESFIAWISSGSENPPVIEIGLAYLAPFVLSFALYTTLIKVLSIDQPKEAGYAYDVRSASQDIGAGSRRPTPAS